MTCEYLNLYHECDEPVVAQVKWKRWGWVGYCTAYHWEMTGDNPTDLMEEKLV